jgi:curved DNA-binding protein CbpA
MKNYYKVLKLDFGATIEQIKKAYRQLAMQYHPDKNKATDAAQKFIEITEAYEVLRDPTLKAEYDAIYKSIFVDTNQSIELINKSKEKQKTWASRGESKAKEYSQMSYDQFLKNAFEEIKFHSGHLARIGCLTYFFIFGGLTMTIGIFFFADSNWTERNKDSGAFIFFPIVGIILLIIGFRQVGNATSDYKDEIKNRY